MTLRSVSWILALALFACGEEDDQPAPHSADAPVHWVTTQDGAEVALQRHATPGGQPVVLVHGISSNHHFWDLEPGRSLAVYLQERGYDVWNMDLRGHGFAEQGSDGKRQKAGWTVDDYAHYDLPAAFDYVLAETGADRLSYVGHSMGGMVLAAYLSENPQPPLDAAVAVGSPLDFRDPDAMTGFLLRNSWVGSGAGFLPTPLGAKLMAGLDTHMPLRADEMLYVPENMTPASRKLMLRRIVSPMSRGEIKQFGASSRDGEFRSADGEIVYREALGEVTVPMLFVAGRADRVASPDHVRTYFDAVGSSDKEFVVASRANGFHGDYGHLDIGLGDHAAVDLFPRVGDWLDRWQ